MFVMCRLFWQKKFWPLWIWEEPPVPYPRDFVYCRFPLLDGAGNDAALLRTAVQTLISLAENKLPTLVGCSGGISRSVAVTAVALSNSTGGTPDEWLTRIAASGPHDVAPAFWNELLLAVK